MPNKITHEEFVKNIFKINPNIKILGQYTRSKDNILCKLNNIKLLEIPYTKKDLLIKDTITNFINE